MLEQILFWSGCSFGCCSKGLIVMILNIYSLIIKFKLRDIFLFESELRFSNKLYFWITLMKRAESSGVMPHGKHDGRSGHTSIEVELLRSIFF